MDVNSYGEGVARFTRETYRKFCDIRGKTKDEIAFRFWDVVVLTASDSDQKQAYEMQIAGKLQRREIPRGVDYLVFADPPGPKIGCGGATMCAVSQLMDIYTDRLDSMYILLINAGGQSQRLVSASALGKIFTALPMGCPPWQVLELKLAAYLPLLARMSPGYLHVASDTIEVFDLGDDGEFSDWNFAQPGLTALAHPSSLQIGSTHGVFVFRNNLSQYKMTAFQSCTEVLQKPSIDTMRRKAAVVIQANSSEETVYTDSLYYFDHSFARRLLEFYKAEVPLKCEIDGYGDYMQPLGENATPDFTSDTRNVSSVNEYLVPTRLRLYRHLKGSPFNVVVMNASRFFHLGTTREYLHNFCGDDDLAKCTGFQQNTFSDFDADNFISHGCTIHSVFKARATIGTSTIVEYCRFDHSVVIGDNCIISHCSCTSASIHISSNLFLHTVPVKQPNTPLTPQYVTLVFHIDDNVKAKVGVSGIDTALQLTFLGKPLSETVAGLVPETKLFAADSFGEVNCSLWYARLFAAKNSMDAALAAALSLVSGKKIDFGLDESTELLSASEVIQNKNVHSMLDNVQQLYVAIRSDDIKTVP